MVNAIVGPVLRLLSLPFVLLTLGLFLLVVNAALLGLTARCSPTGSPSTASCTAVLGGLILAVVELGRRPAAATADRCAALTDRAPGRT